MKNSFFFNLILVLVIVQTSCRSSKDITLFQQSKSDQNNYDILQKAPEHRIKPFDNLYLSVLTLDPEVNKLFNPSLAGNGLSSGTQQMYGTPESRFINGYRVGSDSTINLPILGELNFVGLRLQEAEDLLKIRAQEFLKEPTVQVKLLNFKINITGEVRNPGIYYNYEGNLNIIDAIDMANGITDFADLRNSIVIRQIEAGTKTYKVDVTNKNIYKSDVFYLQPNDLVYLPPNNMKRKRENNTTYSLILSTISTLMVSVALLIKN